jgi:hypothetical protein
MSKTQAEADLKSEIHEQFTFSKRYLDSIHERMNQQEELYRTYIDKTNYPHNARVFDPRVFRVIETVTPRMVANEPTGSFYPTESGDVATSQILNALMKYDWRRAEMFPKVVEFVKSMLIFGTSFGRTYWDFREKSKRRMVPKEINGRTVWTPKNTEEIMVTEFDGPNFETLNIYDCFPDPNATNIHNMRWFIYRTFKTIEELKQQNDLRGEEYYKNLDVLEQKIKDKKEKKTTGNANPEHMEYREHRRIMLSTSELIGQDESSPELVILRRFTNTGWVDYAIEHDVIIREVENPYFHGEIPIIYGVDYPYPGELFGMGEIEPVDRVQRAINAVLNQRLDNVQLVLRNMWKVKKNSGVDLHTLVSAPGNIITTDDMNAVEPVAIPDVTGATFVQTMNYLTSALQNGTGITDYTMGINGEANVANKTATGTRLIQQEANAQFKLKVQLFNHMVIQRIANQWKDLRIQYTTEAQKLRIIGKDQIDYLKKETDLAKTDMMGQPIVPGDLETASKLTLSKDGNFAFLNLLPEDIQPSVAGDYDFIASVSSEQLTDPVIMQENFFTAIDRLSNPQWMQGLMQQQKMPNFAVLTEKMFDKLQLGIEGKDAVTDIQPPQQTMDGMPVPQEQIDATLGAPVQNPLPDMNQILGGANGQA